MKKFIHSNHPLKTHSWTRSTKLLNIIHLLLKPYYLKLCVTRLYSTAENPTENPLQSTETAKEP